MKKIVVTGAAGFIGRHCIAWLVAAGYEVHAVDLVKFETEEKSIIWHRVDLFDAAAVAAFFEIVKPTHLLHLAWFVDPATYRTSTKNVSWVRATLYIVEQFHKYGGARLVVAGTCMEYDWQEGVCVEKVTPVKPPNLYAHSKLALLSVLEPFTQAIGMQFSWARLFFLFGKYEPATRFIPSLINGLLRLEKVECKNSALERDFLCVDDMASALSMLLVSDVTGVVNISSGVAIPLGEIASMIGKKLSRQELVVLHNMPTSEPLTFVGDNTRLRKEVGWQQKYSLEQRLDETILWWQKNHLIVHENKSIHSVL
jgi:nucleoside-diphosphate-sugar epimerase